MVISSGLKDRVAGDLASLVGYRYFSWFLVLNMVSTLWSRNRFRYAGLCVYVITFFLFSGYSNFIHHFRITFVAPDCVAGLSGTTITECQSMKD